MNQIILLEETQMTDIPEGTVCEICEEKAVKKQDDVYLCNDCFEAGNALSETSDELCSKCGCLYEDCICETT